MNNYAFGLVIGGVAAWLFAGVNTLEAWSVAVILLTASVLFMSDQPAA